MRPLYLELSNTLTLQYPLSASFQQHLFWTSVHDAPSPLPPRHFRSLYRSALHLFDFCDNMRTLFLDSAQVLVICLTPRLTIQSGRVEELVKYRIYLEHIQKALMPFHSSLSYLSTLVPALAHLFYGLSKQGLESRFPGIFEGTMLKILGSESETPLMCDD